MLPIQFTDRMESLLGEEYPDFIKSLEGEHYRALRVNLRKGSAEKLIGKSPFTLRQVHWTENGFYYGEMDQPGKHPYHEAGVYYIQEPSAMAPVPFLQAKPGERILDLCAAPGGKTTQIADAMEGEGILICNEIHPARAKTLSENVERMGVRNAVVTNETPQKLSEVFPGYFDRILVDAPCSGEGMFRKNEEASTEWSLENVEHCAHRQDEILDCAAEMLRPGGRLVYSTCTFAPAENEGSISRFLQRHEEFHIVECECPEGFMNGVPAWTEAPAAGIEHTFRLMPHRVQGEGHFLAVLEKEALDGWDGRRSSKNGLEKALSQKECQEFFAFKEEALSGDWKDKGVLLRFGEQLYLAPEEMPAIKGLKVLRPGLHLGTLKKNRFEPSHALALSLRPEQAKQILSLTAKDREVLQFIEGQSLVQGGTDREWQIVTGAEESPLPEAKGWCLVCVDGYSLGWGKMAGTILKNHYPKGLRKTGLNLSRE